MGTRPEIIKMAPVVHHILKAGLQAHVIHTGQHDSMAYPLYNFFGISPQTEISLQRHTGDLTHLTAQLLDNLGKSLNKIKPTVLLVHGDTSSAFSGALAAFLARIPVGHIEAGLRTGERYDPFPEEKNRELIARLANWHFSPTSRAAENLKKEGIAEGSIFTVGNTIIDAVRFVSRHLSMSQDGGMKYLPEELSPLKNFDKNQNKLLLVTAHRRENWGTPISNIAQAVSKLLRRHADILAVWPVHANRMVHQTVAETFSAHLADDTEARSRLVICDPLNYPAFIWLLQRAWLVLTDSGGVQEEASALDRPLLVLRGTTERPELIESGGGLMVGTELQVIVSCVEQLYGDEVKYRAMSNSLNPFGDGTSAEKIVSHIANYLLPIS
jgi:UDP-N-acetylglucosamine 2-epimerase